MGESWPRVKSNEKVTVAVGSGGVLRRFGEVSGHRVDATALPQATVAAGEKAPLLVSTEPAGCAVSIDGVRLPNETPLGVLIDAGREIAVEVLCQNHSPWTRHVLAASGQTVNLTAQLAEPRR